MPKPMTDKAMTAVERVERVLAYDFGDESAHCIALAEAAGELLTLSRQSVGVEEMRPLVARLTNLYAGLSTSSKSYDADAVAKTIDILSRLTGEPD